MSSGKKSDSNFLVQGSILAIASIVSRIIGLLYRIPMTNIIGDTGNSYYSAAFEIYNILLIISAYSLPLAVSKLVSARVSKGQRKNAYRIVKGALLLATGTGLTASLILFFGASFFTNMLNTPLSIFALKVLAPTILVVAVLGVLRGFFQGLGTMMPSAISQIIEQIVNAIVSIAAAYMGQESEQCLEIKKSMALLTVLQVEHWVPIWEQCLHFYSLECCFWHTNVFLNDRCAGIPAAKQNPIRMSFVY